MAKYNAKLMAILLGMFIITQLIGLYVVNFYISDSMQIPYGFDQTGEIEKDANFYAGFFISLVISFVIAIAFVMLLMKINSVWIMRAWFFVVVALALGITLTVFTTKLGLIYPSLIALILGIFFAYIKVYERNVLLHNATELLVYPGVAAIFVALLNLPFTIILLIGISVYDIWAVWHSGIMQKMAKYQINTLGVFSGFFVPYANKKIKEKIKLLRMKYKSNIPLKVLKKNNIKVNLAILGGGDVIFPIIAAGVMLKTFNLTAALCTMAGASFALLTLFIFSKKKKFYPAMPFITAGIFLGMLVGYSLFS